MNWDVIENLDNLRDGIIETVDNFQEQISHFHESYVSKIIPDFGKYGDVAQFAAEMLPGVSEYNAIKDGDWTAFAIAAGIDLTAICVGGLSVGTGYAAVKGGSTAAKAGVKVATKEIAEAGAKKLSKEVVETSIKKVSVEIVENTTEKVFKETVEESVEKSTKETIESISREVTENTADIKRLDCLNENLKGKLHPDTGIEFVEKTIIKQNGEKVIGVFPQFESKLDVQLPSELYTATDYMQFKECNKQLKKLVQSNAKLRGLFDEIQLDQICDNEIPDGYVWHHNEEVGKMQLVDFGIHDATGHTGGKKLWGEGNR